MAIQERRFPTIESAVQAQADDLVVTLRGAISTRGSGWMALSRGRTPRHVFERLRQLEVPWEWATTVMWRHSFLAIMRLSPARDAVP